MTSHGIYICAQLVAGLAYSSLPPPAQTEAGIIAAADEIIVGRWNGELFVRTTSHNYHDEQGELKSTTVDMYIYRIEVEHGPGGDLDSSVIEIAHPKKDGVIFERDVRMILPMKLYQNGLLRNYVLTEKLFYRCDRLVSESAMLTLIQIIRDDGVIDEDEL